MATETSGSHPSGAAAEVKDKGEELVSAAHEQITAKAHELRGEANFQIREQLDQRSTHAGEQLQSIGNTLQSAAADTILGDIEGFARRRPWLTAGVGALAGCLASRFFKASGNRRYEGAHGHGSGYSPSMRSLTSGGA